MMKIFNGPEVKIVSLSMMRWKKMYCLFHVGLWVFLGSAGKALVGRVFIPISLQETDENNASH